MASINYDIPLSTHAANNNSISHFIIAYYGVSKAVTFAFVASFVPNKCVNVSCGQIIFRRHWVFLSDIDEMFSDLFLLRICEIFWLYAEIFAEANNINTFTMLRNSKIHCIYNFWLRHNISDFIKGVQNGFKSFSFVVNNKSFHVFKKKCLWLLPSKNFSHVKEKSTSSFFKAKTFTCKRKRLTRKSCTKNIKVVRDKALCVL